jgi:cytochrome d ubiquinol oxidase subunit II
LTGIDWILPVVWTGILATAVIMYVILDGFDLGLGILFFTTKDESFRDDMMSSVAPYWDGNETWLVLGGGGLFAAFPRAYSIIMPALYIPIILMLLALILRGVAFEFRWAAKPHHQIWDWAFMAGSTLATFAQGLVLGGLLQGIKVENQAFAGDAFDWLSPFSVMCGLGLASGYSLLASCWLRVKTSGPLALHARKLAPRLLLLVGFFAGLVSLWTPLRSPFIAERWFSSPNIFYLWPLPLATILLLYSVNKSIAKGAELMPFFGVIGIFLCCFIGLAISAFPYLIPNSLDLWQAAAAPSSLKFMLAGVMVLLPVILGYTLFSYWAFRGKLGEGEAYH